MDNILSVSSPRNAWRISLHIHLEVFPIAVQIKSHFNQTNENKNVFGRPVFAPFQGFSPFLNHGFQFEFRTRKTDFLLVGLFLFAHTSVCGINLHRPNFVLLKKWQDLSLHKMFVLF